MSWQVVKHITIYREEGWYAAHPNIVRTPNGDLLTLFHRCPDMGCAHHAHPLFDIRSCRSTDEGGTWGPEELVTVYPVGGVIDFGTHTLPDGSIFLHASNVDLIPRGISSVNTEWISRPAIPFWVRSRDDGRTWSQPKTFPPLPDAVWGHPAEHSGVCRSGLLLLQDGRMLMPSKATDHPEGKQPFFGMLRVSTDLGETWEYGGRIAKDDVYHFSEPTIHLTPAGKIIVLYRCHLPEGGTRLALVTSEDRGTTWSQWKLTNILGSPGHILGLRDGRMLITVGTRYEGQLGCTARVVNPEGDDLESALDIVVRKDSLDTDCGYPWSVELEDGKVFVVYYFMYKDGVRGIEGTFLEEK